MSLTRSNIAPSVARFSVKCQSDRQGQCAAARHRLLEEIRDLIGQMSMANTANGRADKAIRLLRIDWLSGRKGALLCWLGGASLPPWDTAPPA